MTIWCTHIEWGITKATNTLSEYVILLFYCNNGCTVTPRCYLAVHRPSCLSFLYSFASKKLQHFSLLPYYHRSIQFFTASSVFLHWFLYSAFVFKFSVPRLYPLTLPLTALNSVNNWDVHKVHCIFTDVCLSVGTYNFFHVAEIASVSTMSLNK